MNKLKLGVCALAVSAILPAAYGSSLTGASVERELKDLRADKRALAAEAGNLGALARVQHLSTWESHADRLTAMRELVNRSGKRIARLESEGQLTAAQREAVKAMREHLSPVAAQTEALIAKINESRVSTRFPAFHGEVQKLVAAAERSAQAADRAVEVALNGTGAGPSGD